MLKIKLSRTGKKRQPSFRIIVQERAAAVKGKFLEELGYYKPAETPKVFKPNLERIKYWLAKGAKPSDSMAVLLKKEGIEGMDEFIEPRDKKRKSKKQATEAAPATPAAPKVDTAQKPAEKPAEKPAV